MKEEKMSAIWPILSLLSERIKRKGGFSKMALDENKILREKRIAIPRQVAVKDKSK